MLCTEAEVGELKDMDITSVKRDRKTVCLKLESASRRITVLLQDVSKETAIFYGPGNIPVPDPEPDYPLDLVETAEVDASSVTLSGYRLNVPWHVWRIEAKSIDLRVE